MNAEGVSSVLTWTAAVEAARQRLDDWDVRVPSWRAERPFELVWALMLYATASGCGWPADRVTAAQLRYRMRDRDELLMWLCRQLAAMGHAVDPPAGVHTAAWMAAGGHDARVQQRPRNLSPASDDAVVRLWREVSAVASGWAEGPDDALFADRTLTGIPECPLWRFRDVTIGVLDRVLVAERVGWPEGTPVRTHGVLRYIAFNGELATERGVVGDQALIDAPVWRLDPSWDTLVDGPPVGYYLKYRSIKGEYGNTRPAGPIGLAHLSADTDAFPGPTPVPTLTSSDPACDRSRHSVIALSTSPAASTTAGTGTAPNRRPAEQHADRPSDQPAEQPVQQSGQRSGQHSRERVEGLFDGDVFRPEAITRLWALRDIELREVGDSAPLRVAERMLAVLPRRDLPAPPPYGSIVMNEEFAWRPDHEARRAAGLVDRQLVTGPARAHLMQWLEQITGTWTTPAQHAALGDLPPRPSLRDALLFLADEGFVEVAAPYIPIASAGSRADSTDDTDAATGSPAALGKPWPERGPEPGPELWVRRWRSCSSTATSPRWRWSRHPRADPRARPVRPRPNPRRWIPRRSANPAVRHQRGHGQRGRGHRPARERRRPLICWRAWRVLTCTTTLR